jgi:hypothetical protein
MAEYNFLKTGYLLSMQLYRKNITFTEAGDAVSFSSLVQYLLVAGLFRACQSCWVGFCNRAVYVLDKIS